MNSTRAASKARRIATSLATRRFSNFRFNYSALGDTVNVASRLEV
jgi:class 3 adenylate cyclase